MINRTTFSACVTALTLAIILITNPGCALLQSSCAKAMPVLAQAQALLSDAQIVVDQATLAVQALPDAHRVKAEAALDDARTSLRAASATLAAASTACSQPSIVEVFAAFARAWTEVRKFLSLFGGEGSAYVPDPVVYGMVMVAPGDK